MTHGQFFEGAICQCGEKLDDLVDDKGWGYIVCPNCKEGYDTQKYAKAGGTFHTGSGCNCERCSNIEYDSMQRKISR